MSFDKIFAITTTIAFVGCTESSDPPAEVPCPTESGKGCAPQSARIDLYAPTFSSSTVVTNTRFPISELDSVVFIGVVDGLPFRTETTLLPETRMIEWNGQPIETLVSQYMSFSDGRIEEIATDWYAQDDVDAVWYFGEDVADYDETGEVYTHEGTWLVGRDGAPLTMIMPGDPHVGDVFLAENVAPIAWEEITIESIDETVEGPRGEVTDVMIASELHMEGTRQEKVFAPGYGEFSTGSIETDDLEALAIAVPTDALPGGAPPELDALVTGTANVFDAADSSDWDAAALELAGVTTSWEAYRLGHVPPLLEAEMDRLLELLSDAVASQESGGARHQAIAVARVAYDFRLAYVPRTEIDRARFDLWLAQVLVDAAAGEEGPVKGDIATLELVWQRIAHTYDGSTKTEIESAIDDLRGASDVTQAASVASQLRESMASDGWN